MIFFNGQIIRVKHSHIPIWIFLCVSGPSFIVTSQNISLNGFICPLYRIFCEGVTKHGVDEIQAKWIVCKYLIYLDAFRRMSVCTAVKTQVTPKGICRYYSANFEKKMTCCPPFSHKLLCCFGNINTV